MTNAPAGDINEIIISFFNVFSNSRAKLSILFATNYIIFCKKNFFLQCLWRNFANHEQIIHWFYFLKKHSDIHNNTEKFGVNFSMKPLSNYLWFHLYNSRKIRTSEILFCVYIDIIVWHLYYFFYLFIHYSCRASGYDENIYIFGDLITPFECN